MWYCQVAHGCMLPGIWSVVLGFVVATVPSVEILRTVDAVLTTQLHSMVSGSVTAALKAFLRFAVRRQRNSLRDIVASGRARVRMAAEAERQKQLAIQREAEAARRRIEEASASKVCVFLLSYVRVRML